IFYLWGHSYEFARQDNWNVIEDFLAYVSDYKEEIWMATNGDIVDYVEACRKLVFSMDGTRVYNPSCRTVWMEAAGEVYSIRAGETAVLKEYQKI
ncbi:MAG: polysaccharide deacetylase, partial [Lachnospiraceae bacterium]|nr:polysaccharide deacetylase [Lachnospiraceae bacterium]